LHGPTAGKHFFTNHTPTTVTTPLSLHDALPIWVVALARNRAVANGFSDQVRNRFCQFNEHADIDETAWQRFAARLHYYPADATSDRKSTRLNSSHVKISYAVFCLKKKTRRRRPSPSPGLTTGFLPPDRTST